MREQADGGGGHLSLPHQSQEGRLGLLPGTPRPLGLGERPDSPTLRASCPLQYEAVMDRVQKSKLSLHKKAMEVSLEGAAGFGVWIPGALGQDWPQASIQQQAQRPVGFLELQISVPGVEAPFPSTAPDGEKGGRAQEPHPGAPKSRASTPPSPRRRMSRSAGMQTMLNRPLSALAPTVSRSRWRRCVESLRRGDVTGLGQGRKGCRRHPQARFPGISGSRWTV